MSRDKYVDGFLEKLLKAIECSLEASQAARETVEAILKGGAETAVFLSGAEDGPGASAPRGLALTPQDREFLRALSIRPDSA